MEDGRPQAHLGSTAGNSDFFKGVAAKKNIHCVFSKIAFGFSKTPFAAQINALCIPEIAQMLFWEVQ